MHHEEEKTVTKPDNPFLVSRYAATDTRWYLNFTRNIYRFSPAYITLDDLSIVHGHNERISEANYLLLANFYHHVILNANKATLDHATPKDEF